MNRSMDALYSIQMGIPSYLCVISRNEQDLNSLGGSKQRPISAVLRMLGQAEPVVGSTAEDEAIRNVAVLTTAWWCRARCSCLAPASGSPSRTSAAGAF